MAPIFAFMEADDVEIPYIQLSLASGQDNKISSRTCNGLLNDSERPDVTSSSRVYRDAAPLVSAIIPAHDAALHLSRAVDSALAQTYAPLEVIVVDDGSRDATYQIAAGYGDRLRVIKLPRPLGPGGARNLAIEAARGSYVAFLDADDEWLPEKTARQIAAISAAPGMTFIYCAADYVSPSPNRPKIVNQDRIPVAGKNAWKTLLAYPFVSTPTVLALRDAVLRAGLFDADLPIAEDQDLWIRLARLGQIGYVEDVMVRVHDTPGSLTKRRAYDGVVHTLKVVDRHVRAATGELSPTEIREIYSERYARLGRNAYEAGAIALGIRLLWRSINLGRPALPVLAYLFAASHIGRLVRRKVGHAFYDDSAGATTDLRSSLDR